MTDRGFTLIETLVALTVLLTAIVGPMALAQRSLSTSVHTKDQVAAFFLAQDAVEFIKSVRDTDRAEGTTHFNMFSVCNNASGCYLDTTLSSASPATACSGVCPKMQYRSLYGEYGYSTGSGWQESNFRRTVYLDVISVYEEYIEVKVEWETDGNTRSLLLERYFYDLEST